MFQLFTWKRVVDDLTPQQVQPVFKVENKGVQFIVNETELKERLRTLKPLERVSVDKVKDVFGCDVAKKYEDIRKYNSLEKKMLIDHLKECFNIIDSRGGGHKSINEIMEMFLILCQNKWILLHHTPYYTSIQKKLDEFYVLDTYTSLLLYRFKELLFP